jgi:hypothetical protein
MPPCGTFQNLSSSGQRPEPPFTLHPSPFTRFKIHGGLHVS